MENVFENIGTEGCVTQKWFKTQEHTKYISIMNIRKSWLFKTCMEKQLLVIILQFPPLYAKCIAIGGQLDIKFFNILPQMILLKITSKRSILRLHTYALV